MVDKKSVLVVSVDRDDDFGKKAKVEGPIFGRKANLNAAAKLALADPEDTDSNCAFAAIKKMEEAKKYYANVEIVTLTGVGKFGLESDKRINEQLEEVLEKFPADAFILVTDGAEDDQVIPILQSRAPIISKETVIVKQAKQIESTYYTIKEALTDPFLQKAVFGIPGIIILILLVMPSLGSQLIFGAVGAFLLIYGFGIYTRASDIVKTITKSITALRSSFPLYIAAVCVFGFGIISAYTSFYASPVVTDVLASAFDAAVQFFFFTFIASELFICGKAIDLIHIKRAYRIRSYFISGVAILLIWLIVESVLNVVAGKADLSSFLLSIVLSFIIFVVCFKISEIFDVRNKITKLLIGLPVYSRKGNWIGKVEGITKDKQSIEYSTIKGKEKQKAKRTEFTLRRGKITLSG